MKLFIKLFLWFLVALSLIVAVITFITRTYQTDPMFSRAQRSTKNQMVIYADTATQIARAEGEDGLRTFLTRLGDVQPQRAVNLVHANGANWFGDPGTLEHSRDVVARTIEAGSVETVTSEERTVGAAPVLFPDGQRYALVMQWERTAPPNLFFGGWRSYARLGGVLLVSVLLCYVLALYLTSPIRKLRRTTTQLASGDLRARVPDRVAKRRDEIGDLARDFDIMAEQIESLITTQQRLNSDISHELRSPLARLNVALEIAKTRANPGMESVLKRIEEESNRLNEMIGRLLTLAKLESGAEDVERVRVDLTELVRDIAADAEYEAQANGRYVELSEIEPVTVVGSENLLRSAIENVLRNAVKYTAEGTAVNVSLQKRNGDAVLKISDHGGGVPEEELPNLFRPFYRVGLARERKTGGTGLGLAIADRAIRAHRGTIVARNHNGGLQVEIGLHREKA